MHLTMIHLLRRHSNTSDADLVNTTINLSTKYNIWKCVWSSKTERIQQSTSALRICGQIHCNTTINLILIHKINLNEVLHYRCWSYHPSFPNTHPPPNLTSTWPAVYHPACLIFWTKASCWIDLVHQSHRASAFSNSFTAMIMDK